MALRPLILGICGALGACALALGAAPANVQAQTGGLAAKTQPLLRENVAVVVDDEAITTYELKQMLAWLAVTQNTQPTPETLPQLQQEALRELIDQTLQTQELRRQETQRRLKPGTLFADDQQIDSYIENLAKDNNMTSEQFMQLLERGGVTRKFVRQQFSTLLSWRGWNFNYYRNRIRISDDRIEAMMREIAAAASKPSYLISEIFIDSARAGSLENAVNAGNQLIGLLRQNARFENLARQYSALPSAAQGGDAGWLTVAELEPEVAQAVESLRPGQVTQPIPTRDGAYVVLLRERRAGGTETMVNLRQAAVLLPADATPQQLQAAQTQLMQVKSRVTGGCASLQTAAQGQRGVEVGDLGETETKELASPFREAVEKLQPNQVSDPVRTSVGLHLIALCSRTATGAGSRTREEVEDLLFSRELAMIQRRELRNLRNAATISQPR